MRVLAMMLLCENHTIPGLCSKLQSPIVRLANCLPVETGIKEKAISSLFSNSCSSLGLATILFSTLRIILSYPSDTVAESNNVIIIIHLSFFQLLAGDTVIASREWVLGWLYPLVCGWCGPGSCPGAGAGGDMACEEHARGSCSSADVSNIRFVLLISALPGARKKPPARR